MSENKSNTSAVFPIVRALQRAQEFGKAETGWTPNGPGAKMQERYIPLLASLEKQLHNFSPEELKAIASDDHEIINFWLKKNGFNIELEPFQDPESFGVASIMSVLVKWVTAGTETELDVDGKTYKAARLEENITFSEVNGNPVAHIQTQNGDEVHLMVADDTTLQGLDLLERCKGISDKRGESYKWGGLVFPFVDLDQEVDIKFFLGMGFEGTGAQGGKGRLAIMQAKQQTKFKMNHIGAKAESAAAFEMGLECCFMPKPDLVIDKPFYAWMTRQGLDVPYFAGYIDTSDWKDPGEIK
jgi:hypothetical protein